METKPESFKDYRKWLKKELLQRQRTNPSYSLRAFAQFLGVHPGSLSNVLNGQRHLTKKMAEKISKKLGLSPQKKAELDFALDVHRNGLNELAQTPIEFADKILIDESYHNVIAQWEHYALLSLIKTDDFKSDISWISRRLRVAPLQAENTIENLKNCGLIEINEDGKISRTHGRLDTSRDIRSVALQKSHEEILQIAQKKLTEIEPEDRGYFSENIAVNMEKLDEAKSLIREFKQKLATLLEEGPKTEVYNLSVQLFPLTDLKGNEGEKNEAN